MKSEEAGPARSLRSSAVLAQELRIPLATLVLGCLTTGALGAGWLHPSAGLAAALIFALVTWSLGKASSKATARVIETENDLRQAEVALRERDSMLRSFFDGSNLMMGISALAGDEFIYISANAATGRFFGMDPAVLVNKSPRELGLSEESRALWLKHYRHCYATRQPVTFEYLRPMPYGTRCLAATVSFIDLPSASRPSFAYLVEDVTDRKRIESALRENEARFRAMNDASPLGIFVVDNEGRCLYTNSAYQSITGLTADQALGYGWHNALYPDDRERLFHEIATVPAGGLRQMELRHVNPDGHVVWTSARTAAMRDGETLLGHVGTLEDITERRKADEALRRSEERFQLAVHGSSDGIWDWPIGKQEIYFSPRLKELLGYEEHEIDGSSLEFQTRLHADDRDLFDKALALHLEARVPYDVEYRLLTHSGEYRWFRARGQALWNDEGVPIRMAGSLQDVTAHRQAKEALRVAKEGAEAANRTKSAFLANMSHEIRTPMNAILGMADVLSRTLLNPEQARYVKIFQSAGDDLLELLNDVLDLSKIEAGFLTLEHIEFNLIELIEETTEFMSGRAQGKGLELSSWISADTPRWVMGDPTRFRQVLINLLGNALKFTEAGEVALKVEPAIGEGCLSFAVTDTGVGIPEDKLGYLFSNFSQLDPSMTRRYGGTGLGLAISRHLVELMKGSIQVESREGHGSTFSFCIPLQPAPARPEAQESPLVLTAPAEVGRAEDQASSPVAVKPAAMPSGNPSAGGLSPLRILLAEDVADNRALIQLLLADGGHTIAEAENGEQAFQMATKGDWSVILMDVQMPVMDGHTATQMIRMYERGYGLPPVPIVALTAHAFAEDARKSLEAGCDVHLTKPIRRSELLRVLREYARRPSSEALLEVSVEASSPSPAAPIEVIASAREQVFIDAMFEPMIPGFLHNRREEAGRLVEAAVREDYTTMRELGHGLKGVGGSFGFDYITELGKKIEQAARMGDGPLALENINELNAHLDRLEVVFTP